MSYKRISPIPVIEGGTQVKTWTTAYGLLCAGTSVTSPIQTLSSLGAAGVILTSQGAGALPTWTTAVYPATTTTNQLLWSNGANNVVGLATAASGVLITSAGSVPSISQTLPSAVQGNITTVGALTSGSLATGFTVVTVPLGGTSASSFTQNGMLYGNGTSAIGVTSGMTDGQIVIGSSIGVPAAAALIAGPNITITNGHNTIQISALSGSDVVSYTGIANANTPYTALSTD